MPTSAYEYMVLMESAVPKAAAIRPNTIRKMSQYFCHLNGETTRNQPAAGIQGVVHPPPPPQQSLNVRWEESAIVEVAESVLVS